MIQDEDWKSCWMLYAEVVFGDFGKSGHICLKFCEKHGHCQ